MSVLHDRLLKEILQLYLKCTMTTTVATTITSAMICYDHENSNHTTVTISIASIFFFPHRLSSPAEGLLVLALVLVLMLVLGTTSTFAPNRAG